MNICICISGQVRGDLEELKSLKSQIDELPDNVKITVVFSVWEAASAKIDGHMAYAQMFRVFEKDLAQIIPISYYGNDFWKNFPQTYNSIILNSDKNVEAKLKSIFPEAIFDVEKDILDLEFNELKKDKNSIKMLYKRWRCNEIKRKIEKNNNEKFDLVLLTRPDAKIRVNAVELDHLESQSLGIPTPYFRESFTNDVMAYGRTDLIDIYCALFAKSIDLYNWKDIHIELFEHLKANNIKEVEPKAFTCQGLAANKLLKVDDVLNDNEFIRSIYIGKPDLGILNSEEKISFFTKLFLEERGVDDISSLKNFILADISNRKIPNFKFNRNKYVMDLMLEVTDVLGIDTLDKLFKIDGLIINPLAEINLKQIFSDVRFIEHKKNNYIASCINEKNLDVLLNIADGSNLPNRLADGFRDLALDYEKSDLPIASKLMKIAKDIRPAGPRIVQKYNEYKLKLEKNEKTNS